MLHKIKTYFVEILLHVGQIKERNQNSNKGRNRVVAVSWESARCATGTQEETVVTEELDEGINE